MIAALARRVSATAGASSLRLLPLFLLVVLCACSGGSDTPPSADATPGADGVISRPQNRAGIGDVERAFDRYAATRGDLIALYQAQPWFQDGLSRDESLFVERGLSFVSRYSDARNVSIPEETIRRKLYLYKTAPVQKGEVELLLIYEPGQDAARQMALMERAIPALEEIVGVEYPERMLTVINGAFEINDFNEGQFIRIARCCPLSPIILTHELAHAYWSIGPSWFNEGMADIYSIFALDLISENPPPGWGNAGADIDAYYRSRKSAVDSGRFRDMVLPRRFARDGLYEVADVFLLDIRTILGAGDFFAAAREIYQTSDFGRYTLREKRIEDTFLRYADDDEDREKIMALFNRLIWGDNGERYRELQEFEAP